jgi:tetratricopeptide (TPR) repeat protein
MTQTLQQLQILMKDYAPLVKNPITCDELGNRGCELQAVGSMSQALAYFEKAILADPASGRAYFNRSQLLSNLSRHDEALSGYQMAALLGLDFVDLDHNTSMALYWLYRPQEALEHCDRALARAPIESRAIMLNSRCLILMDLARPEEALHAADEAVRLSPGFHMARLNRALANLTLGRWREGWEDYEVRWHGAHEAQTGVFTRPQIPLPQWQGQATPKGQGLFVYTEQGLGDTIQFVRYVIAARQHFTRLTLACPESALPLLRHSLSGLDIELQPLERVKIDGCQWQCPLLSMPYAMRDLLPEPYENGPYIRAQEHHVADWQKRLATLPANKPKVGLCWAGSATLRRDPQRSIAFNVIRPLLERTDVSWISLQKSDDKANHFRGTHPHLIDWSQDFTDLAQTAALISQLDLVICVDTSISHLSAAMGKTVWLLSRFEGEWRWMHKREDSPWYPTLRIFRQEKHLQWAGMMKRIEKELDTLSNSQRTS